MGEGWELCERFWNSRVLRCSSPSVAHANVKQNTMEVSRVFFCRCCLWVCVSSERLCVCVSECVCTCHCGRMCVNPQRSKAPMPLCSCQQHAPYPPPLWLRGSGGLTFHSSDPLFHRANSYAGLEMCYVAGWDKNQGQFPTKFMTPVLRVFLFLPICLPIHFCDLISIKNLAVNKDIYIWRTFTILKEMWLCLTYKTLLYISEFPSESSCWRSTSSLMHYISLFAYFHYVFVFTLYSKSH